MCTATFSVADEKFALPFDPRSLIQAGAEGDTAQIAQTGTNIAAGMASDYVRQQFLNFIPTAEVTLRLSDKYDLGGSALVLVPVWENDNHSSLVFTQGSVTRFNDRTTTNIGLGARRLVMDKKLLLGANAFYDQE